MKKTSRQIVRSFVLLAMPLCALAEVYDLPPEGNDVVGSLTTIMARADDTLLEIARRHGLGYEDIVRQIQMLMHGCRARALP